MKEIRYCNQYLDEDYIHLVIEYRGDFEAQINNVDYACGSVVTENLGVVAVKQHDIKRLRNDVPAIIFIEPRSIYVLQDINPSNSDNINKVKSNPYLNLTGRNVVVGMIDTGINYLNQEFINEDGTSRVIKIWDQTIQTDNNKLGTIYNNEQINNAIEAYKSGKDPYEIVPSKDEINHGTKMAGIIGARGYSSKFQGIAHNCEFLIVKLLESPNYLKILRENNLPKVAVYSNAEVLSAIEYLWRTARELGKPLVIFFGLGSHDGSHDGYNITARFITILGSREGVVFITGTGNAGSSAGHVLEFVKNVGEIKNVELLVTRDMKKLEFYVWIQKPDEMALNVIDPSGEEMGFMISKIYRERDKDFFMIDTNLKIQCYNPENFTGHQVFALDFTNIKSGIWKLQLRGEYISNGRFDIWLPDRSLLPEGTKFLNPNPYNTLTIPSTARKVTTVSYYNSANNSIVAESGKGFNTNFLINPDIAADGINVLTTSGVNDIVKVSGSSVATAIVAGASCLFIQWQLANKKYSGLYSTKLRSLLIYSAKREQGYIYPNEEIGYGKLDIFNVFNVLGGSRADKSYIEYFINNLFIRLPIK